MSDFKSKLPDLKELSAMTSKLFHGIKKSVDEIVQDYKQKRVEEERINKAQEAHQTTPETPANNTIVTPPVTPVQPPVTPSVVTEDDAQKEK